MPVEIYQTDRSIFEQHWVGDVTLKDIAESHQRIADLADAQRVPHYVHIIVMTHLKRFPLNVPSVLGVIHGYSAFEAAFVVDCPKAVAIAGGVLQQMIPAKHIYFYADVDKANMAAGTFLYNLEQQARA